MDDFGDGSARASKQTDKLAKSSGRGRRGLLLMGRAAKYGGIALGGFAIVAGKKSVDAASSLNEEVNKTAVVFGRSSKGVLAWSKGTANSLGLSQRAALEGASSIGAMLVPMGLGRSKAAGMSKGMTTLAADMASFNNQDPSEMLDRIRAGLSGESEPLKRFGSVLSETRVKQHAWNMGIAENGKVLTEKQKILGRYSLLMKDTTDQQGDFGRTSKSWANVQRRLSGVIENTSAKLGTRFIPYLKRGGEWLIKFITGMDKGTGTGGEFADVMTGIWQGVKPVAAWFGRAAKKIATFASEHPNLVKFAAGVAAIKLAVGRLGGGGFFGSQGRFGAGAFASGFKSGVGAYLGTRAAERIAARLGGRFKGPMGTAGDKGADALANGLGVSLDAKKGRFRRMGSKMGRAIGGPLGLAGALTAALVFEDPIVKWLEHQGKRIEQLTGKNPIAGDDGKIGDPLRGLDPTRNDFWKGTPFYNEPRTPRRTHTPRPGNRPGGRRERTPRPTNRPGGRVAAAAAGVPVIENHLYLKIGERDVTVAVERQDVRQRGRA